MRQQICALTQRSRPSHLIPLRGGLVLPFAALLVFSTSGCVNLQSGLKKLLVADPAIVARRAPTVPPDQRMVSAIRPRVSIDEGEASSVAPASTVSRPPRVEAEAAAVIPAPAPVTQPAPAPKASADELAMYKEQALLRPDDAVVRFQLGRLLLDRGLVDQAAYELDMATSLDPTMADGFLLLGRALRLKSQYDLAVAKLRAALQLNPRLVEALIEEGICWDQRGYYERARDAYRRALQLRPNDPTIYNNIGVSYFYQGDHENALKNYKKALAIDPNNPQTNNNIAVVAAARGDYDLAFEYFSRALGQAAAHNNVGYLLLRAARFDQAIKHLREAVKLNPMSVTALANLEAALRMTGNTSEAEQVHAQYLKAQQAEATAKK